jgi:catechol 2,3-dioxygenase-like lactoylglutathione lyase family enzyme
MIFYTTVGTDDVEAGKAFYDATLSTLGWERQADYGHIAGYGPPGAASPTLWVTKPFDGASARAGNGIMIALEAARPAQVHAFYDAALAAGGSDEGPPGPRPDYGPAWYAAYLRDPTGNKLAVVCNTPQ